MKASRPKQATRASPSVPAKPQRPRFELDRVWVLRAVFVVVVVAFLALFVRVASMGFGLNSKAVETFDRKMLAPSSEQKAPSR